MNTRRILNNEKATLAVDLYGGAFIDFRLHGQHINPLGFKFKSGDMPENNKGGAPYQGHFVCSGRWGEPSEGEIKAGVPNHGHLANILWEAECTTDDDRTFCMTATSQVEGLHVRRSIEMDRSNPVVAVEEKVTNVQPLGRLFNIVQHPTFSSPFLDNSMIVDCNATHGFNQAFSSKPVQYASEWPYGYHPQFQYLNLRKLDHAHNSLYSFIVDKQCKEGWITVFSPKNKTVLGYVWKRSEYPWVHLWQDWHGDTIRYRGIEFGTAGYHMPFNQIIQHPMRLFGENVSAYIDACETVSKRFLSFIFHVGDDFHGVESVQIDTGNIIIKGRNKEEVTFSTIFKEFMFD